MHFDFLDVNFTKGRCITVRATLYSHESGDIADYEIADFVLDTGATSVHISKSLLAQLGYDEKLFYRDKNKSYSVTGEYNALLCKVKQFSFCGVKFRNRVVKVWNPPDGHHVDGIIGMDILSYFNLAINMDTQKATIERSQATNTKLRKST